MKVFVVSLGCAKNRTDTERLLAKLGEGSELELVFHPEDADLILINTCAFIRPAVRESIDTILELAEYKRNGQILAVIGCLVARYGEEVVKSFPEVDIFCGTEAFKVPEVFRKPEKAVVLRPEGGDSPVKRVLTESPFYAYIKVTEGCSHACSFCTIPRIRGPLRSRPVEEIVEEAKALLDEGVKEVILVGQDVASYGRDRGKRELVSLVERLSELPELKRIRLLYLHPKELLKDSLEVFRVPKVAPYADIPVQHAHKKILKAMRRGYSAEEVKELVQKLREVRPGIGIRTSLIVGFPGEGEEEFEFLKEFISDVRFDHLGVFVYWPEENTPASRLKPRIKHREALKRKKELLKLQKEISKALLRDRREAEDLVLITGLDSKGRPVGHAGFQAPEVDGVTFVTKGIPVSPGDLVRVRIVRTFTYDVWAEALEVVS